MRTLDFFFPLTLRTFCCPDFLDLCYHDVKPGNFYGLRAKIYILGWVVQSLIKLT